MTGPPIINIEDVEYEEQSRGDAYEARFGHLARHLGAQKLGCRIVIQPAGKAAWPYHAHMGNEEMFFILSGSGTLRHEGGEHPLRAGDVVAAPPGPGSAHQIVNTSDGDLTYLAVSTMESPEVVRYPKSGKIGYITGSAPGGDKEKRWNWGFLSEEGAVEYWDGED